MEGKKEKTKKTIDFCRAIALCVREREAAAASVEQ
jgi:hypothetical protein